MPIDSEGVHTRVILAGEELMLDKEQTNSRKVWRFQCGAENPF